MIFCLLEDVDFLVAEFCIFLVDDAGTEVCFLFIMVDLEGCESIKYSTIKYRLLIKVGNKYY